MKITSLLCLLAFCKLSKGSEETKDRLVDWFLAKGGYFNAKQQIRLDDPDLADESRYAVFAKDAIQEGEVLATIPWSTIIDENENDGEVPDEEEDLAQFHCGTARNVEEEFQLGDKSAYHPYLEHLRAQPARYHIPSTYSEQGKSLLLEIIGGEHSPTVLMESAAHYDIYDWQTICDADEDDEDGNMAAMLVMQHSFQDLMVPMYDFYTHRNGKFHNTEVTVVQGDKVEIRARRPIDAGEQLHISYNKCDSCPYPLEGVYGTAEIFRDHGILEDFPQLWSIPEGNLVLPFESPEGEEQQLVAEGITFQYALHKDEETGDITVEFFGLEPGLHHWLDSLFLQRIHVVNRLKNIEVPDSPEDYEGMPQHESDAIWKFYDAYATAMKRAVLALHAKMRPKDVHPQNENEIQQQFKYWDHHYTLLEVELDHLSYNSPECNSSELTDFFSYQPYELENSNYQELEWQYREEDDDICLHLDKMLQICTSYRPHYHEFFVHYPARYLPSVKRVIFLGSGDAMLLHEILKYPELEKVVGLELDQHVTRKSFKHFKTQPHYDDPRVEWWYGDATKTLPLLPREYWGSFDLLLVDLSETVVSLHVTGKHDVLDVISMLLKPEGVMLENELYIDAMSRHFDHTVHIFYGSPKVCIQVHTVASNSVDFMRAPIYDHGIDMYLIDKVETPLDPYKFIHDYVKTNPRWQKQCELENLAAGVTEHGRKAGILMVLEAENTTKDLASLEGSIYKVLHSHGLNPISEPQGKSGGTITVVLKEGYVVARPWPELNYVGFDISFWGAYNKMVSVRAALAEAVGSESKSSFRVVVGGMHGSSTWEDDQETIGIQFSQKRNCTVPDLQAKTLDVDEILEVAFDETVELLIEPEDVVAVVACGRKEDADKCTSIQLLESHPKMKRVIPVWTCDDIPDFNNGTEDFSSMYECERQIINQLDDINESEDLDFDIFILDLSAPISMAQIFSSVFGEGPVRERWLSVPYVFAVPFPKLERKRRRFLDVYRKIGHGWIATMAETAFKGRDGSFFGFRTFAFGDLDAVHSVADMEKSLKQRLPDTDIIVRLVEGGQYHANGDLELEGRSFTFDDYDVGPNQKQFSEQRPLGRQTIFQMEMVANASMPSWGEMTNAFQKSLEGGDAAPTQLESTLGVGDGGVVTALFTTGNAVLTWDGLQHVDVNLFRLDESRELADSFLKEFLSQCGDRLSRTLRDDQPRGIGRVVNFLSDIVKDNMANVTRELPEEEEEMEEEEEEMEEAELSKRRMKFGIGAVAALLGYSATVVHGSADKNPLDKFGIINWIQSTDGGFFNPKQELRLSDPEDPASDLMLYATRDIKEGEVLSQIPWRLLISSDSGVNSSGDLSCNTTRILMREMELGEESTYAPMMEYLKSLPPGQLPSSWSDAGKALLLEVLGGAEDQELPPGSPTVLVEADWFQQCGGTPDGEVAAALIMRRGVFDTYMVPTYDWYTHRNGDYFNAQTELKLNQQFLVTARRDIKAGEPLHNSFDLCDKCDLNAVEEGYSSAEIFRDYGFVEDYPRRFSIQPNAIQLENDEGGSWLYSPEHIQFQIVQSEDGTPAAKWAKHLIFDDRGRNYVRRLFRTHLRRLYRVGNIDYDLESEEPTLVENIPQQEWDLIREYYFAWIEAFRTGIQSLTNEGDETGLPCDETTSDLEGFCPCPNVDTNDVHYDDLLNQIDNDNYIYPTCSTTQLLEFGDYYDLDEVQTTYQKLWFMRRDEDDDICMNLENTLQICSNYRPHYHEFFVHYPSRFVDKIERVIWIGGGDAMLLHEVLKYPELKKVVGLELDQQVTRKSFKFFNSQPHWDDDRVEWWYGDATKTLPLLPQDYWGSFDLVLVDLSETVMSFSVTQTMDIFSALSLLLHPKGVMVKNEPYLDEFSAFFDYSIHLFYGSPKICTQVLVMGSNSVDFLHRPTKDHGVPRVLMEPLDEDYSTRYKYLHDYRKTNARTQGKCMEGDEDENAPARTEHGKKAGFVELLDAEGVDKDGLEEKLHTIVKEQGLTPLAPPANQESSPTTVVVMKEGYIVARTFEGLDYIAFDFNLWGAFPKLEPLRNSILETVGSASNSFYRVVLGGMHGASTLEEDQKSIGIQIRQTRNCSIPEERHVDVEASELVNPAWGVALEATMNTIKEDVVTVVFCGFEGDECQGNTVLRKLSKKVLTVFTCPELKEHSPESPLFDHMYSCEQSIEEQLLKMVSMYGEIRAIVFDKSAPHVAGQLLDSILSDTENRAELLDPKIILMSFLTDPVKDLWRRNVVERLRVFSNVNPAEKAEITMVSGQHTFEYVMLGAADRLFFQHLTDIEASIRDGLPDFDAIEARNVTGGMRYYDSEYDVKLFDPDTYDPKPAKDQAARQRPLGRQCIFQFEHVTKEEEDSSDDDDTPSNEAEDKQDEGMPDLEHLNQFLKTSLEEIGIGPSTVTRWDSYTDVGDGAVIVSVFQQGSAILVWDGQTHLDINLFTKTQTKENADKFLDKFADLSGLQRTLRDDQPRGTGSVVQYDFEIEGAPKEEQKTTEDSAKPASEPTTSEGEL